MTQTFIYAIYCPNKQEVKIGQKKKLQIYF
jgi:hypothetical protein